MLKLIYFFASKVLRKFVLNIKDVTPEQRVERRLRRGDELCKGRTTPMSKYLTEKVADIYRKCKSSNSDTPLILALEMGLTDIAWAFIECANQTNTNLHTGQTNTNLHTGLVRKDHVVEFYWLSNEKKMTAFHIAFKKNHVEMMRVLLSRANESYLTSVWDLIRVHLPRLLNHDSKFDGFIFDILKKRTNQLKGQLKFQKDMNRRYNLRHKLDKLGNGLLGSNASQNTILHLVSKIGDVSSTRYILENQTSQICSRNFNTETPGYVAAREGHANILELILYKLKGNNENIELNLTRSIDQHNALHIAIQNYNVEVIFLLMEEIPQLANCINKVKESPLYLAAERGYFEVVELMLKNCTEIAVDGPNGKTALHAAAISDSALCIEHLLRERPHLLNVKDNRGWTALHHAVYRNSSSAIRKLLNVDYTIGYQELILEDGVKTSPIHVAASLGHCETIEVLMGLCPGCSEFIDSKGRSILHVAIENKRNKVIEFIFGNESLKSLINQQDNNGNTPIHLLVASDFDNMMMLMDSRVNINVLNNENLTPLDMISSDDQRERLIKGMTKGIKIHNKPNASLSPDTNNKSGVIETYWETKPLKKEGRFAIADNLIVVAALIATASYAAGFTVPGGFDSSDGSKQGTPFLLKKSAFQAFIVTNAIAFASSCSVLLAHISLLFYRNRYEDTDRDEQERIDGKIQDMYYITTLALIALTIAFVTGVYVMLTPSLGLAISVCVMSLLLMAFIMHEDKFQQSQQSQSVLPVLSSMDILSY